MAEKYKKALSVASLLVVLSPFTLFAAPLASTCYTTTDPTASLWPYNPCRKIFHGTVNEVAAPFDKGSIRRNPQAATPNCVEILFPDPSAPGFPLNWIPYNPSDNEHVRWANYYHRYGRGVSRGHGHGIDSLVCPVEYFRIARGRTDLNCNSIEIIDTWFCDGLLYQLIAEADRVTQGQLPPVDTPVVPPTTTNPTTPTVPTIPTNPNCDGLCQSQDLLCRDNRPVGGRCPSDCEPCGPVSPVVVTPVVTPPVVVTPSTIPPITPPVIILPPDKPTPDPICLDSLTKCELALESLSISSTTQSTALKARISSLESLISALSQPTAKPVLPTEISTILSEEWSRVSSAGAGLRARYQRMVRQLCSLYDCKSIGR